MIKMVEELSELSQALCKSLIRLNYTKEKISLEDDLKSVRIESEQEKLNRLNDRKSRKDRNYYISEGMLLAYGIVADYLDDLEVIT